MKQKDLIVWSGCALLFCAGAVWGGVWPRADFFKIADIHDLLEIGSAIATIFAVVFGVSAWKKQLRGQSDHELARRVLLNAEKLKAQTLVMIWSARNCLGSNYIHFADWSKIQAILKELRADIANSDACRANLDAVLLETDIMWGDELRNSYHKIYELLGICRYCVQSYVDFLEDPDSDDEAGNDDLDWVEKRLAEGAWDRTEVEMRSQMSDFVSEASDYLKRKLVS